MVAPTIVFATEEFTSSAMDQDSNEILTFQGAQSGSGESESMSGISGDGLTPSEKLVPFVNDDGVSPLAANCTAWWITGNQGWRWRGITGLFVNNTIHGQTRTYSGTRANNNACGQPPLIVDRITVELESRGLQNILRASKTAYNASNVNTEKKYRGVGSNAEAVCGVIGRNIAFKNGITWQTGGQTGC